MRAGVLAGAVLAWLCSSAAAQQCPAGPVALVLSGGGAKGIAHVGVLEVLDSLGIVPDMVVGTSIGALVGAAYAGGMSGTQIDSVVRTLPLATLFRPYDRRVLRARGTLRPLVIWEEQPAGWTIASPAAREAEVNTLISALLLPANLRAAGDFDRLPIPFRAVAAELPRAGAVTLRSGDLAKSVRASIAIPLVLPPVRIDGRLLVDGGLAANIPVSVARAEGAAQVIVVDVTEALPEAGESTELVTEIVLDLVSYQPPDSLGPHDVRIRPEVDGAAMLDFSAAQVAALRELGRTAARRELAGRPCLPRGRQPRPPAAGLPVLAAVAGDPSLARALELRPGALDARGLTARVRALGASGEYRALWLTPAGSRDSLRLAPEGVSTPERRAALGADYDSDTGGRVWAALEDRSVLGGAVTAGAGVFVGEQRQEVNTAARLAPPLAGRAGILHQYVLAVRAAHENVPRFDGGESALHPHETREAIASLGADPLFVDGWFATVGPHLHVWSEPGRRVRWAAGGVLRAGRIFPATGDAFALESVWNPDYARAEAMASRRFTLGAYTLRPRLMAVWSRDAPVQSVPPLGGVEGFPGLRYGEIRGERTLMAGLLVVRPLAGLFTLRLEASAGRVTGSPHAPSATTDVFGAGVGLGVETWVGPARAEYGRTTDGRDALRVRIGG